jgi:N-carbamoyl-L-amino-acid hydrolase
MTVTYTINPERLQKFQDDFAQFGKTDKGGLNRLTLTDEDKQARDLFVELAKQAGCTIKVDAIGNIFARRAGTEPDLPAVLTGSHTDSQPLGGRFDGTYGVLAALEALYSLNDHNIQTRHPIDLVVWTNEEGARFAPAIVGFQCLLRSGRARGCAGQNRSGRQNHGRRAQTYWLCRDR